VLRAVLALGKGLGVPVLTEGVETLRQLEMLRAEGCDQAQGFYLGRPSPASALIAAGVVAIAPPGRRLPRVLPNVA
jgi:EAL domain-containing protein (putative c-di-GMP-specific phosphodiesterase class I)